MTPGRLALAVTAALFIMAVSLFTLLATPGSDYANSFCLSCHVVREEAKALAQTSHAEVACLNCHQRPGVLGAIDSVFEGATNLAAWINPFDVSAAARSDTIDQSRCVSCHKQTARARDVIDADLVVDHRHFSAVGFSCLECHRGVAHGERIKRGVGMTKGMCLGCHNGLDASRECGVCHKQEVAGVRPSDPSTTLGLGHGKNWRRTHGLGELSSCSLCHKPEECKKCHGIGLPHGDNFVFKHGAVAAGKALNAGAEAAETGAERPDDQGADSQSDEVQGSDGDDGGATEGASGEAEETTADAAQTSSEKPSGGDDRLAKGRTLFEAKCQICHGLDRPRNAPYKGAQWDALVERMRGKGAPLSDVDAKAVLPYLKSTNGGRDDPGSAKSESGGGASASSGADLGYVTAINKNVTGPQKVCGQCHQQSYCRDCHAGVEMPHGDRWMAEHKDKTPEAKIPACFKCHVNDECLSCHTGHTQKGLVFPSGPVLGGVPQGGRQ